MTVYVPAHFVAPDAKAVARVLHEYPFATLITPGDQEPFVSHVPLLHVAGAEPHGMLIGHVARANPHWRHATEVESLAIFHGPHAYVSPSWYQQPDRMVPTWNYAAVHVHGTLHIIEDAAGARAVLDALIARFENGRGEPWAMQRLADTQRDAMIAAIVAFRMPITRIEGKFKLSQNRSAVDRARLAAALAAEGYAEATATAEWMIQYAGAGDRPDGSR